jgi:hypothetical protein
VTRDAVRHRDAESSADAGLDGRDEPVWTKAGLLITQRSRVQIPPPLLTSFRRSRPFPIRERAFCVPDAVAKRVAAAVLHAALQGDRGDGVTRDETAWTWWTLPPATAGRLAQKYRRCTGVRAGPARTHSRRIEAWRRCYVLTPSANTVRALSRTYRRFSAVNSRGREAGDRAQISLFGVRMQDSFSEVHLNGPVASRPPERR